MQIFFTLSLSIILGQTTAPAMPTPSLIQAVQSNRMTLFGQLLKGGANINAIDKLGRTAAHYAVVHNNLHALQMLLDEGAEVNLSDKQGKRLLDLWQTHRDKDMLVLLQKAGAAGTAQDLWQAAASNDIAAAKRLLTEGANAQAKNKAGKVPFHIAVEAEHYSLAAILLKAAQGINGRDEQGWTSLMWAIVADDYDLVREFIAEDASVGSGRYQNAWDVAEMMESEAKLLKIIVEEMGMDASVVTTVLKLKDRHGIRNRDVISWQPLHWAIIADDWDMVHKFIKDGTDPNAGHIQKALDIAEMMENEKKLLEVIVEEMGMDVSVIATAMKLKDRHSIKSRDIISWTPLHWAIVADDWNMVHELIRDGTDISAGHIQKVLDIAEMMESEDKLIEAVIAARGVNAIIGLGGRTVLIDAASEAKAKAVSFLLKHGANIERQRFSGTDCTIACCVGGKDRDNRDGCLAT